MEGHRLVAAQCRGLFARLYFLLKGREGGCCLAGCGQREDAFATGIGCGIKQLSVKKGRKIH